MWRVLGRLARIGVLFHTIFLITVLRFLEVAVSCPINGLVLSGIGVIDVP